MGTLTVALDTPGMGYLHRAGLAGLWLTLEALNEELRGASPRPLARRLEELGSWELTNRSITLRWEGAGTEFFKSLLEYAYPVAEADGLMYFSALGDPYQFRQDTFATHSAMLATFLQHPRVRKAESGKATGRVAVQVDDSTETFTIRRVRSHNFATETYRPDKVDTVAGWLVPGGAERHVGLGASTRLSEEPGPMLALRFAPVGCLFYLMKQHGAGGGTRYQTSIVVPEVRDLMDYADLRRVVHQTVDVRDLYSAGPADAALRLLERDAGREAAHRFRSQESRRCRVIAYGSVPWSSQQRTRVRVLEVDHLPLREVARFREIRRYLPARRVRRAADARADDDSGTSAWVDVPQVPELAAENLIRGRPWWRGFAQFVADRERRDHVFRWEWKGLHEMVRDTAVTPEDEAARLVRACHEAWRRRLGQLADRAKNQSLNRERLWDQEFERTRIAFSRCKTQAEFRRTVTDFWARGGSQQELREHWPAVLPYLTDRRRWEEGRDLALLALASYGSDGAGDGAGQPGPAASTGA